MKGKKIKIAIFSLKIKSIIGNPDGQYAAQFEIETILGLTPGSIASMAYGTQMAGYAATGAGYYGGAAASAYGQSYGAYGAQQQYQAVDPSYYAAYGQQQAAATAAVPTDPTAYYNDFWQYAMYYGEAAARQCYGAWSPPEGTPPPAGIVIPQATGQPTAESYAAASSSSTTSSGENTYNPESASTEAQAMTPEQAEEAAKAWEEYNKKVT
jgi:hypothetical protein